MRAAPAVSVQGDGARLWRCVCAALPAAALAAVVAWSLGRAGLDGTPALALLPIAAVVLWWRRRPVVATLSWDGQRWLVDGTPGQLRVMIDLGPWLLLHLQPAASGQPGRWLPLAAHEAGPALHALRAALYARPPPVRAPLGPGAR